MVPLVLLKFVFLDDLRFQSVPEKLDCNLRFWLLFRLFSTVVKFIRECKLKGALNLFPLCKCKTIN